MSRETWEKIGQRFDADAPPEPRWRAERDLSPVPEIEAALAAPELGFGSPHVLLTGTWGTGKTTELLRLAEQRAKAGEFVVFLDVVKHFSIAVGDIAALQEISAWEVCYLVGVALIRVSTEVFGYEFPPDHLRELQGAWETLAKATETPLPGPQVDLGALAKSVSLVVSAAAAPGAPLVAAGLKLLAGVTGSVKWSLGRSKKAVQDQEISAQNLLACVNRLFATFRQMSRRALFIIDGLDRVIELDRAEELFVKSEMIARLDCPVVVTGPFVLRNHMATALAQRFSEKLTLANAPVLNPKNPSEYGPGVGFLCGLYRKRVTDLDAGELIDAPDLERLAYYSGGRLRDFVKTIRMLALSAWTADAPRATREMVDGVLRKARLLMEQGVDGGHVEVLERIVRDPKHNLPPGKHESELARDLLKYGRLLPYSNGSEWFYPHPLLTMNKVSAEPPGSAT
jgi:hypothetical protein